MKIDYTIDPYYHPDEPDYDIEIQPFTKTNWKHPSSKLTWEELHPRMHRAMDEAEWRSVLDSRTKRKAAIIHVDNYNREMWLERLAREDLFYRPIRYSKPYDGFSHKHFPTDIHDLTRHTYAVISTDEEVAEAFVRAETGQDNYVDHHTIGGFLGFPKCCRDFFDEVWTNQGIIDPMYEAACNTKNAEMIDGDPENILIPDPNPGANVLWRYFGWSFLTHIPCSWDCEDSLEIARERYRIMCECGYEDAANALVNWLSEPAVWTGHHGLMHITNRHIIGSSKTSNYWTRKRIVWGEVNEPGGIIPGASPSSFSP